jgi:hypothetical protein
MYSYVKLLYICICCMLTGCILLCFLLVGIDIMNYGVMSGGGVSGWVLWCLIGLHGEICADICTYIEHLHASTSTQSLTTSLTASLTTSQLHHSFTTSLISISLTYIIHYITHFIIHYTTHYITHYTTHYITHYITGRMHG